MSPSLAVFIALLLPVMPQFARMSPERELALGRSLAVELEQRATLLNDPRVVEYVNRVGQNIARNSDSKFPITIKVLDSAEVNASAFPGGFLYVTTGLIQTADNEAQLAAMIAQAVADVASGLRTVLAIPSSGSSSVVVVPTQQVGLVELPAIDYQNLRRAVEEADRLGQQYLYRAGYDPRAMPAFFQKIAAQKKGPSGPELFATHPKTEDRAKKSLDNIRKLPLREQNIVTTPEFQEIKNRLTQTGPR
jgi:predicted Zn-dependent protease